MTQTEANYVRQTPEGTWRIGDSRVSLDSVAHAYWEGQSPEAIAEDFPTLTPEQVYGAIAFYLRNREELDQYFAKQDERWRELANVSEEKNGPLLNRLRSQRCRIAPDAAS